MNGQCAYFHETHFSNLVKIWPLLLSLSVCHGQTHRRLHIKLYFCFVKNAQDCKPKRSGLCYSFPEASAHVPSRDLCCYRMAWRLQEEVATRWRSKSLFGLMEFVEKDLPGGRGACCLPWISLYGPAVEHNNACVRDLVKHNASTEITCPLHFIDSNWICDVSVKSVKQIRNVIFSFFVEKERVVDTVQSHKVVVALNFAEL